MPARNVERRAGIQQQQGSHRKLPAIGRKQWRNDDDPQNSWSWQPSPLARRAIAGPALAQNEQFFPAPGLSHWSLRARTASRSPTASPTTGPCSTSATAASTASRSCSRNARPATRPTRASNATSASRARAPPAPRYFSPLSTGITFALTEKVPGDKIPLLTLGYGRSESRDGTVFPWNFIAVGSYWTAADVAIQHVAKELGGFDKLKGKKISLVYHDSPYGKEPIPALEARAKLNGFEFKAIPSPTRVSSRSRSGWRSARTGPTTCFSGAGAS